MAEILNDIEIKKLLNKVIVRGDENCIRPYSYILRMGNEGGFLIDEQKGEKGIIIPPGHSTELTSYEDIDFSREKINEIYPGYALHAFITPTTNLSMEGIAAPPTQIEAGYRGTLNLTVVNTANQERRYLHKSRVFRITIFKLSKNEIPLKSYDGHYHQQSGYVKSKRHTAHVGMKEKEWEGTFKEDGTEDLVDILAKSGLPWNALTQRLRIIDDQFKSIHDEYKDIRDSIEAFKKQVIQVRTDQSNLLYKINTIVKVLSKDESSELKNRWLLGVGSLFFVFSSLLITVTTNNSAISFMQHQDCWLGIFNFIVAGIFLYTWILRKKKKLNI